VSTARRGSAAVGVRRRAVSAGTIGAVLAVMHTIDIDDLGRVRGGEGFVDSLKSGASTAWQGTKDFTGGFASGYLGRGPDGQLWGDSSSRASKAGGELGEFAGSGMGPSRFPRPRR
jgi:hypothetical protein